MPGWADARQTRVPTRAARLSLRIAGKCIVTGCIKHQSPRDSSADEWVCRISRGVDHLLAVFGAALSGAWLQTRTRWTHTNVSSFALVCSGLGNSPSTGMRSQIFL